MDCPGAVSLSASKAILSFSQSIIVDVSETPGLPDLIKNSYRTGSASIPIIILTDPTLQKIYGRFDHPAMKSQKYPTIFKDAKTQIAKAITDGSFTTSPKKTTLIKVKNPILQTWKSAAGTEIKAKLIGIEDNSTYLFENEAGKTFRATASQLDPASIKKAQQTARQPTKPTKPST